MLRANKFTAIELLLLVTLVSTACLASIDKSEERNPVRVTHRNSGPSYWIERDDNSNDVEKTRLSPASSDDESSMPPMMRPVKPMGEQEADNWQPSVGHISIRRIFLVPMMPSSQADDKPQEGADEPQARRQHPLLFSGSMGPQSDEREGAPSRQPLWPFMSPSSSSLHHLFGQDAASRSPSSPKDDKDSSAVKPDEKNPTDGRQLIDPIQMMIEMMQNALNSAAMMPPPSSTDLNKEASANKDEEERKETGIEKPDDLIKRIVKPLNETKEEVVEIDGKKYLRKTIVNRHVGENMVFMTRRLVFVPLNETTTEQADGQSTTTSTPATTLASEQPSTTVASEETGKRTEAPMTTTEAPISTTAWSTSTEAASTTTAASQPEEMTTSKDAPVEKETPNSNERLVSSTSPKPMETTTSV